MAKSPKQVDAETQLVLKAWEEKAKTKTFGGMTLDQYKARIKPSYDARGLIKSLDVQMTTAIADREDADVETLAANQDVVKGVVGDKEFGEDSALYEAMGYVRKSERKSGLSRKQTPPPAEKK